jgi:uncharacterized protein (TIGR00255 family)
MLEKGCTASRKREETMAIRSMTGFGRAESADENYKFTVELKSVNQRFLDYNVRMPRRLGTFEASIRNLLKNYITRGKVDVSVSFEDLARKNRFLQYDQELAAQYMNAFQQMAATFSIPMDVGVSRLASCPDVLLMEEVQAEEEALWSLLEKAVTQAAGQLVESRIAEGENLKKDLCGKLEHMLELVEQVELRAPQVLEAYRKRLTEKVGELLADTTVEESRLAAEVVLYADKICVDEETVRLKSHIKHMGEVLKEGDGIGRKLDFITQEMNREANTILSKANDLETSDLAIELKTEIEKIREQIQNIE